VVAPLTKENITVPLTKSDLIASVAAHTGSTAKDVATWVLTGTDVPEDGEQALVDAGCAVVRVPNSAGS